MTRTFGDNDVVNEDNEPSSTEPRLRSVVEPALLHRTREFEEPPPSLLFEFFALLCG